MHIERESIALYYDGRGRYACICNKGYFWSITQEKCLPIVKACSIYNPCGKFRGKCKIISNDQSGSKYLYECECNPAYAGKFCELATCPCMNANNEKKCPKPHACIRDPSSHEGFRCECAQGYVPNSILDPTCVDINECDSYIEVCKNGGECSNLPGSYMCSCLLGFSGKNCEKDERKRNYGKWLDWGSFSKCSVAYGSRYEIAYRNCTLPYRCSGSNSRTRICSKYSNQRGAHSELIGLVANEDDIEKTEIKLKLAKIKMSKIYERLFPSSNITYKKYEFEVSFGNPKSFMKKYFFIYNFYLFFRILFNY
jgi:hypothetical protein